MKKKITDSVMVGVDGDVIPMVAVSATTNVPSTYIESPVLGDDDDFYNADAYHNIFGSRSAREARRKERVSSKADARRLRAQAKLEAAKAKTIQAKSQIEAARASKEGVKADTALAESLAKTAPTPSAEEPKKLSTGAKIGIGVGIAAVLGTIIFIVVRQMKKGKK